MDLRIVEQVSATGTYTLSLRGSLDLMSKGELIAAGELALQATGSTGLVLNLAGVEFIDSTGIGAIIEVSSFAADLGRTFALQSPSARVARVLELTGLSDNWPTVPNAV
ncbi:STAS domain-containing protein [Jatrophihabitans telluris]|uniref:Anti-sigma factor antagonist n=1 Tax=Jatrophihabitans telluris TaxID=2038343 RepID=A0ABY4R0C2_9ACTN|nr:STAS domain-containing protein [Jatrophihabitans telluris]UQX89038.1 STAS domain-containing protein [Jatrophihabitans telluris]